MAPLDTFGPCEGCPGESCQIGLAVPLQQDLTQPITLIEVAAGGRLKGVKHVKGVSPASVTTFRAKAAV